jgi:hypothetical protein
MQNLRFSQQWLWRVQYSAIYCNVVSLKHQLTFNTLHGIISQKIVLFNYKVDFREIGCQDVKQMNQFSSRVLLYWKYWHFGSWNVYSLNLKSIYEYTYLIVYSLISCLGHFNNTHINNTHARNIPYGLRTLCPNLTCHYNYPHYYMR